MSYELHLHNLSRLHDEYETALQQRNAEGKKLGDVVLFDGKTCELWLRPAAIPGKVWIWPDLKSDGLVRNGHGVQLARIRT